MAKEFDLCDVLSAATGVLISERGIGAVYDVLNFWTGERLFTHQLPRVGREFKEGLKAAHPELAPVFDEAKNITRDNWREFANDWTARFGATISITPATESDHQHIDALSELTEKFHHDNIHVANVGGGE